MPDLQQIYRQILNDILERLHENSLTREEAIDRIREVSQVWYYWNADYNDDDFLGYAQIYYPQFAGLTHA